MKQGFRQSMAWLHTWTGLLVGWLLLLIFMAGTASYYRDEITRWMKPELTGQRVEADLAAERALAYLATKAPKAEQWTVTLPGERNPALRMFWRNPESMVKPRPEGERRRGRGRDGRFGDATLDATTGQEVKARETRGGDFFYRLHFDLYYIPVLWARWLVGFCAMFMLVAIITGVVTHKKIFTDFFTFRPGKGQRSWLDFHNASAVFALPYHAMITYTGIVTLMFMYLPWGVKVAYPQDEDAFFTEAFGGMADVRPASGEPMAARSVDELLAIARGQWQDRDVDAFTMHNPGDRNAVFEARQTEGKRISTQTPAIRIDAVTGQVMENSHPPGGASETRNVMYGLHVARFGGWPMHALFFISGLAGCLMVASGVVLWAVKERQKHAKSGRISFGLRLVDALNIGTVAGLTIAFPAYFWANRLLPLDMAERPRGEADVFFYAWAAALVLAFLWPRRRMWSLQLWIGGLLFAAIPLLNVLTSTRHLGHTLSEGDWAVAGVDIVTCAIGVVICYTAVRVQRWTPPLSAAQKRAKHTAPPAAPIDATPAVTP
jgi:uncharacterized iron-regulated membrane protein